MTQSYFTTAGTGERPVVVGKPFLPGFLPGLSPGFFAFLDVGRFSGAGAMSG